MSAAIPTQIPEQLIVGATASWKISLPDFPATDGWTLTYSFLRHDSGLKITITAGASGADHLVNESAATTTGYVPGNYVGQAIVSKSGASYPVWEGALLIKAGFATADGTDPRSQARKILDAYEDAILKLALAQSSGRAGGIVEWTAEGIHIKRSSPEALMVALRTERDRWKAIVNSETAALLRRNGKATGRRILTRFRSPC